jgi:hypothetical protein
MGGPISLLFVQLNAALGTIVAGEVIGEGTLIGWDVPGHSVWIQTPEGMNSVPLPPL